MRSAAAARRRQFHVAAMLLVASVVLAIGWFTQLQPDVLAVVAWTLWFCVVLAAFVLLPWLKSAYQAHVRRQHVHQIFLKGQSRAQGRL